MIYLAAPYTHSDPRVVEERVERIERTWIKLLDRGYNVVQLVTAGHHAHQHGVILEHSRWMALDFALITQCHTLWILTLDGWANSDGVRREIEFALGQEKLVQFIDYETHSVRNYLPHQA